VDSVDLEGILSKKNRMIVKEDTKEDTKEEDTKDVGDKVG
jgi:hypothetical protein